MRMRADFLLILLWISGSILSISLAPEEVPSGMETSDDLSQAVNVLVLILVVTAITIYLMRKFPSSIRVLYFFAISVGVFLLLSLFLGLDLSISSILSIIVGILTVRKFNLVLSNTGLLLALVGISLNLGVIFSIGVLTVLLVLLAIYDVIAVFWTKHMIYMFEEMRERSGFVPAFLIPIGDDVAGLGGGDLVFPASFFVSMRMYCGLKCSLLAMFLSLIGLLVTVYLNRYRRGLPAIPGLASGCILSLILKDFI